MTETKVNIADLSGIRCLFILMVELYCPTLRPIQVQTDKMCTDLMEMCMGLRVGAMKTFPQIYCRTQFPQSQYRSRSRCWTV